MSSVLKPQWLSPVGWGARSDGAGGNRVLAQVATFTLQIEEFGVSSMTAPPIATPSLVELFSD